MGFWINKPVIAEFAEDLPKGYVRTRSYLGYTCNKGLLWEAKEGTETDGASIPWVWRMIIGQPLDPSYIEAAIIHDTYCNNKKRPSKEVHAVFLEMLCDSPDVPKWKKKAMGLATRFGGPKWSMQS
jgi:hypothetical protein